jgi:uncharacterized protein involved in outer membrane biogenesis
MKVRGLFWIIPLAAVVLVIAVIITLPGLVASNEHRTAIESLASSLTGRDVHIGGKLSLALFPEPQLIAERITISGPDRETITAKSLTLEIAMDTLLRGHLTARSLTLQSPVIAFPWPLPGGAAAVAPPPWLATLHAQINDGQISLGSVAFQHVNADLFTGADGAVSIAGSGTLLQQPVNLSLGLGPIGATGAAPLTIDGQDGNASLHVSGSFSAASTLTGSLSLAAPGMAGTVPAGADPAYAQPVMATAGVTADPEEIELTNLRLTQGNGVITGTARLEIASARVNLVLAASNLTLPQTPPPISLPILNTLSIHVTLDADDPIFAGVLIPHLWTEASISGAGITITSLNAALPGNGAFQLSGTIDQNGNLRGNASLNSDDLTALAAAFGGRLPVPASWRQASLNAALTGNTGRLNLASLSGTIGAAFIKGTAVLSPSAAGPTLYGAVHFDQLDLTPLTAAFRPAASTATQAAGSLSGGALSGGLEITAGRASLLGVPMTRLLIDATFGPELVVRRFSASIYNGLAAGSFTVAPDGQISAARALFSLPSATPIAALLPPHLRPPAGLAGGKLSAFLLAAGPPAHLSTSLALTLGDINAFTAPVLDLTSLTAAGPLLLRHPSAIALFKAFGLNAGLAYPGAGSVSLRADFLASQSQFGLPDFVLSMGDLTAAGKLIFTPDSGLNGNIAADTLALPPFPAGLWPLWAALTGAKGKISIAANRVLFAGAQLFGSSAASLTLQPDKAAFTLSNAAFSGGALSGNLAATLSPSAPPAITGTASITGANIAGINLPATFPLTLPSGVITAQAALTASGYTPQAWAATLSGGAAISAANGAISGFNLAGLATALAQTPREAALRDACLTGSTAFSTLTVTGNFTNGIYSIANAALQGLAGAATATGSIDLPDQAAALNLSFIPNVATPPRLGLAMIGPWSAPHKIPAIKEGLDWQPEN